ncbi:MAG: hypothetical protein MIO92_01750, partial [Methanosarcinaceae archaeon]|nr:hypothetical protein [Methanosarcinaceae archaeon]
KDRSVRLWDLQSGKTICQFKGDSAITSCLFSKDERTIVAGETSGAVHFLRIHNVELLRHGRSQSLDHALKTDFRSLGDEVTSGSKCCFCDSELDRLCVEVPPGLLCLDCLSGSLDRISASVELSSFSSEEVTNALSPDGDLLPRLILLWRFREVVEIADAEEKTRLMQLLVDNLGYIDELGGQIVRQLAYEKCVSPSVWDEIVPIALRSVRTEPWQFYANVLLVLGTLEPENPEVKKVLANASGDVRSEVRSFVLAAVDRHDAVWTRALIGRLISDPDLEVREQAKSVLEAWDMK